MVAAIPGLLRGVFGFGNRGWHHGVRIESAGKNRSTVRFAFKLRDIVSISCPRVRGVIGITPAGAATFSLIRLQQDTYQARCAVPIV